MRKLRSMLILGGAAIASASIFGLVGLKANSADAAPLPALANVETASALETVGWRRRYWRRYGVWPTAPRPIIGDAPAVIIDDDDDGVVFARPIRPRSCGEYHYWDGIACVDARYNDPYLGPK